jgi:L-threonylcarbamoyladenylate synthase
MKIIYIDSQEPDSKILRKAANLLFKGGIIIHATETVYGLTAKWDQAYALERITKIKSRTSDKPYSLMLSSVDDVLSITGLKDNRIEKFLNIIYPAPITLILERRKKLEVTYWNSFPEIGFRIPDHRLSTKLAEEVGAPLITTSANESGKSPAKSFTELSPEIIEKVDLVLNSGKCIFNAPSTIIKIQSNLKSFSVLREGAYPTSKFQTIFKQYFKSEAE